MEEEKPYTNQYTKQKKNKHKYIQYIHEATIDWSYLYPNVLHAG